MLYSDVERNEYCAILAFCSLSRCETFMNTQPPLSVFTCLGAYPSRSSLVFDGRSPLKAYVFAAMSRIHLFRFAKVALLCCQQCAYFYFYSCPVFCNIHHCSLCCAPLWKMGNIAEIRMFLGPSLKGRSHFSISFLPSIW